MKKTLGKNYKKMCPQCAAGTHGGRIVLREIKFDKNGKAIREVIKK